MDALTIFPELGSMAGVATSHPVTLPDFVIKYEQKDITLDIKPGLISIEYTDYLGDQSDELSVTFEDVDGKWLRAWYPNQGDALSLSIGDQFTGLINLGSFEIAEIEYDVMPSVMTLKALSTGITRAHRTLQPKSYEHTTLAKIVRMVAKRLKLSVSGTVADIKIERVTQYQERDIEFLTRLARQYGHTFKIVNKTLVFMANAELAKQEPVAILQPEEIKSARFRDLIKGVPAKAVVTGYDTKTKKVRKVTRKAKSLRRRAKRATTSDTLKIVANKGESDQQMAARADAALTDAQQSQVSGSLTLFGNAKLVAGQVIQLKNLGQMSGKYLVKQARHELRRNSGYGVSLDIKMLEYVADTPEKTNPQSNPQTSSKVAPNAKNL